MTVIRLGQTRVEAASSRWGQSGKRGLRGQNRLMTANHRIMIALPVLVAAMFGAAATPRWARVSGPQALPRHATIHGATASQRR
jgi:hypothetical protein